MPTGIYIRNPEIEKLRRVKISNAMKGKIPKNLALIHSKECRKKARPKISEAMMGNKNGSFISKEARMKRNERMKGENNPARRPEVRQKLKGKNNPNWKGGITSENRLKREKFEYHQWRLSVFERDKFLCQMPDCDKIGRYLNAHHIKRWIEFPDLRLDINNGITLCRKCHNKTKGKEKIFEKLFLEILNLKNTTL